MTERTQPIVGPKDPSLDERVDEIEDYWQGRYLSAPEAMWRMLGFHIQKKDPSVTALPIHLPESRRHRQYSRRNGSESTISKLDRYFLRPNGTFIYHDLPRSFDSVTYTEYYSLFRLAAYDESKDDNLRYFRERTNSVDSPQMHVILRDDPNAHLCRLYTAKPSDGELFYLRTILQNRPVRSFDDALTVDDVKLASYQEAAAAAGLFTTHTEAALAMMEAVTTLRTPQQMRMLFADMLLNDCVPSPLTLWTEFSEAMSFDHLTRHNNNADIALNHTLSDIQSYLDEHGTTLDFYGLPSPHFHRQETSLEIERWGSNVDALTTRATAAYRRFNAMQKQIFDTIWSAISSNSPLCLFINGKAGTGKTTIINVLCDAIRGRGGIILPTATSAFAAQLYLGGRTTHSTFKVRDIISYC